MKTVRLRSLQAKLALRLAALYVAATAIVVAALIYQAYETADTLNDRELSLRAADLARYVTIQPEPPVLSCRRSLPPAIRPPVILISLQFAAHPMRSLRPRRRTSVKLQPNGRRERTTRAISILRTLAVKAASTTV